MKVILDELSPIDFFNHGGIVILNNGKKIDNCKDFYHLSDEERVGPFESAYIGIDFYHYYFADDKFNYIKLEERTAKRDPYGIPNVCFSLIDDTDERWKEFTKQRIERGFDASELWSLDYNIARFIVPRLKAFKEETCGFPASLSEKEWDEILDKMIKAFEDIINDKNDEKIKEIDEGLNLFNKYFLDLWY